MTPAEQNLRDHQTQLDMDGVMVGVSRQAIDEVLAEIERLRAALAIIAGEKPSPDNLLGNADIARIALHGK